jgi:hypothetical protein
VSYTQHHDPDTLLTAIYCVVDDLFQEHFAHRRVRRGRRPELADSEVLTLAILAQWRGERSERAFLEYAKAHLTAYFPRLLHVTNINRRSRDLMGVLCHLGPLISQYATQMLGLSPATHEVMDGLPWPLMRRTRGRRHRLFADEAAFGRAGSDRDWYYGLKMVATIDDRGFLTGFVAGPANTEERWLAEAMFRWRRHPEVRPPSAEDMADVLGPAHRRRGRRQGPTGPIGPRQGVGQPSPVPAIGDLGYSGTAWIQHWSHDYQAIVLTKADYATMAQPDRRRAERWLSGLRQYVETVYGRLVADFGFSFPLARTLWGLHTRLGAKVAAFNLSVYLNHLFGRPPQAAWHCLG